MSSTIPGHLNYYDVDTGNASVTIIEGIVVLFTLIQPSTDLAKQITGNKPITIQLSQESLYALDISVNINGSKHETPCAFLAKLTSVN